MSRFLGQVLSFIGTAIMILTLCWGFFLAFVEIDAGRHGSNAVILILIYSTAVGLPFLLGHGLDRIGKNLRDGKPVGVVWDPDEYKKYPPPPAAAPPHFGLRQEAVDVESEQSEPLVTANDEPPLGAAPAKVEELYPKNRPRKPDPTAMGVDELVNPEDR